MSTHTHRSTPSVTLRPPEGQRSQAKGTSTRPFLGRRAHHTPALWSPQIRRHGEGEEQGATKPTYSPQEFPELRRPCSTHTYATIPNTPPHTHTQQEPLQLPTISTNYHTCWERDLINSPLGLEGEPGPRAGMLGLPPLTHVAFQVWGKGLQ